MTRNYLISQRYTEELRYIEEEGARKSIKVTLQSATGQRFVWETCDKSVPYKYFKENNTGTFTFTYKGDLFDSKIISHLRLVA